MRRAATEALQGPSPEQLAREFLIARGIHPPDAIAMIDSFVCNGWSLEPHAASVLVREGQVAGRRSLMVEFSGRERQGGVAVHVGLQASLPAELQDMRNNAPFGEFGRKGETPPQGVTTIEIGQDTIRLLNKTDSRFGNVQKLVKIGLRDGSIELRIQFNQPLIQAIQTPHAA